MRENKFTHTHLHATTTIHTHPASRSNSSTMLARANYLGHHPASSLNHAHSHKLFCFHIRKGGCRVLRNKIPFASSEAKIVYHRISLVNIAVLIQIRKLSFLNIVYAVNRRHKMHYIFLPVAKFGYCGCYGNYICQCLMMIKVINARLVQVPASQFIRMVWAKSA